MNKLFTKVMVDAIMFISFTSTLAVGLILKILPTGGGRTAGKFFLGVYRHAWGDLHFFMAVIFVASLVVHVILNWGWITACAKRYAGEKWQKTLYGLAVAWVGVLICGWIVLLIL
jgi:hypothetical protein